MLLKRNDKIEKNKTKKNKKQFQTYEAAVNLLPLF